MGPDAKPHSLNKWWKLLIGISKVVITDLKEIDIHTQKIWCAQFV